jgi:hypothetical protein
MTAGPGYGASQTFVFANAPSTIPDPLATVSTGGARPPILPWVTLTNSSPFNVLVSRGTVLGWLAAFTADTFFMDQTFNTSVPLTLLPFQSPNTIEPGFDHTVYAVWYENDPGGIYPAAIGDAAIRTVITSDLINANGIVGPGIISFPILANLLAPFQGLSIFFQDVVPADTTVWVLQVVFSSGGGSIVTEELVVVGPGDVVQFQTPVYAAQVAISLNGTGLAGMQSNLQVAGVLAPVSSFMTAAPFPSGVLMDAGLISIANGATAILGGTGFIYAGDVWVGVSGLGPWTLRMDQMDTTGIFTNKWNVNSADLPATAPSPPGATLAQPAHWQWKTVFPAAPVQFRLTNNSGALNSYQLYVVGNINN